MRKAVFSTNSPSWNELQRQTDVNRSQHPAYKDFKLKDVVYLTTEDMDRIREDFSLLHGSSYLFRLTPWESSPDKERECILLCSRNDKLGLLLGNLYNQYCFAIWPVPF